MTTINTPLGPIDFVPRDLSRWPRNAKPPTADPSRLRGLTVHYSGGALASRYRGGIEAGDLATVGSAISNHNARTDPDTGRKTMADVGYQALIGRSGKIYDGRGIAAMNGANGPILTSIRNQYPTGTTTSNPFFGSVFVCVGTDAGFDQMTEPQRVALARWWAFFVDFFKISTPILNGHRDVRATACPGPKTLAELPQIAAQWPPAPTCKVSNPAHPEWSCWPANKTKPTIGAGSSGDAVAYLHGVLRAFGYTAPAGGVWATATGNAVAAVQKSNKLPIDRVVGKTTWDVIDTIALRAK